MDDQKNLLTHANNRPSYIETFKQYVLHKDKTELEPGIKTSDRIVAYFHRSRSALTILSIIYIVVLVIEI
jgi:hypothetical protein